MNKFGIIANGVKLPLIQNGDPLLEICSDVVSDLIKSNDLKLHNRDIIALTESIVARAQGNYATVDDIATCVYNKFKDESVGIVFPILSRNRFSNILKGLSKNAKKVYLLLSYPSDEMGNHFISEMDVFKAKIDPSSQFFSEGEFRKIFKNINHQFTNIDYLKLYRDIVGSKCQIILSNNPSDILKYTKNVVISDVHTRYITKEKILLKDKTAQIILLEEILNKSTNSSGYNPDFGVLGSNYVNDEKLKLFPRDCFKFCLELQKSIYKKTKIKVECLVYGDGAFKDPVGKIWELADPVVAVGYTKGLIGTPNEIKLKSCIDNAVNQNDKIKLNDEIKAQITKKSKNLVGSSASLGTTPRQITDLVGSLADLVSGSGDRGTPMVIIQNYFSNYSN